MRAYHFLSAKNALDDIRNNRIRISLVDSLNDPFELWCSSQTDTRVRDLLRNWKESMAKQFGILCFTKSWHNTLLWSHYADGHRGICLGFEVRDKLLKPVSYKRERASLRFPVDNNQIMDLLFTKFADWAYEEELRVWLRLEEKDASGHYFYEFDNDLKLHDIIAGPLCDLESSVIKAAANEYDYPLSITKARLAFKTFRVVANKRGFRK